MKPLQAIWWATGALQLKLSVKLVHLRKPNFHNFPITNQLHDECTDEPIESIHEAGQFLIAFGKLAISHQTNPIHSGCQTTSNRIVRCEIGWEVENIAGHSLNGWKYRNCCAIINMSIKNHLRIFMKTLIAQLLCLWLLSEWDCLQFILCAEKTDPFNCANEKKRDKKCVQQRRSIYLIW